MKPVVAIICETSQQGPHAFHQAADKYVQALVRCAGVTPVLLPSLNDPIPPAEILTFAHGILFTGAYSNIQRHHYGLAAATEGETEDPTRDKNTLPLIPQVIAAGLPLMAICRGFQELNVALGGTLHPELHTVAGKFDHREDTSEPVEVQYGPSHEITLTDGSLLQGILPTNRFTVNSVHGQGVNLVAPSLMVEATADDGTVEAVSVRRAKGYALGMQWHPEWDAWNDKQSTLIFRSFGEAARAFLNAKD
ncbi:MAG: gamma-glutamyl-gamma-aminobutyrate hydrolase family protein [Kordiimonadaceae bacterium]|nr:gamma-glutamyl-gamma-aminobutyrate hydrolase family protein [Kordiimonadaceae bacterium]